MNTQSNNQPSSRINNPVRRPRRLRTTPTIRRLVTETRLTPDRLVLPLFVVEGENIQEPIDALPGRSRLSIDNTLRECSHAQTLGINSFVLFPVTPRELKTPRAEEALNPENLACQTIRALRNEFPDVCIITDVALDPYSSLGHDGLVSAEGEILNDETVAILAQMAVLHAETGADIVAPSDMMDGRVAAIRTALDSERHINTIILSYTAKYASAFYGPFRAALDSAPVDAPKVPSDKKTYQMNPANTREAALEALLDEQEGADILMVKPALPYLDIIAKLRQQSNLPIAAYNVSGEYAMIKAAAERGWLDERACISEVLTGIARAGADIIFTYSALDFATWYREENQ